MSLKTLGLSDKKVSDEKIADLLKTSGKVSQNNLLRLQQKLKKYLTIKQEQISKKPL